MGELFESEMSIIGKGVNVYMSTLCERHLNVMGNVICVGSDDTR